MLFRSLINSVGMDISRWKELVVNDFEDFAFSKHPEIGSLKDALYSSGALYSSMSGSGSSVYGIFSQRPVIDSRLRNWVIYEGVM